MNKYQNKKRHHPRYAAEPSGILRHFLLVVSIIFFFGAGYFLYLYKQQPQRYPAINTYALRFKTWMTERNHRLHQGVQQVKNMTAQNAEEQPIHFEFYTTLPKMQVASTTQDTEPQLQPEPKPTVQPTFKPKPEVKIVQVAVTPEKITISNADSLEKDLFAQIEQTKKR